jgi:hypothetical protein
MPRGAPFAFSSSCFISVFCNRVANNVHTRIGRRPARRDIQHQERGLSLAERGGPGTGQSCIAGTSACSPAPPRACNQAHFLSTVPGLAARLPQAGSPARRSKDAPPSPPAPLVTSLPPSSRPGCSPEPARRRLPAGCSAPIPGSHASPPARGPACRAPALPCWRPPTGAPGLGQGPPQHKVCFSCCHTITLYAGLLPSRSKFRNLDPSRHPRCRLALPGRPQEASTRVEDYGRVGPGRIACRRAETAGSLRSRQNHGTGRDRGGRPGRPDRVAHVRSPVLWHCAARPSSGLDAGPV